MHSLGLWVEVRDVRDAPRNHTGGHTPQHQRTSKLKDGSNLHACIPAGTPGQGAHTQASVHGGSGLAWYPVTISKRQGGAGLQQIDTRGGMIAGGSILQTYFRYLG